MLTARIKQGRCMRPIKGIVSMITINESTVPLQGQSNDVEEFGLFEIKHKLGKGIKGQIKSFGCHWNSLLQGWICPMMYVDEVRNSIQHAQLSYEFRTVRLPKGFIPTNPKIAGRQCRLDILVQQAYQDERQLLGDVYGYDPSLRPEDFSQLRPEEKKTAAQIQIEKDFHQRWIDLQMKKETIEKTTKDLEHLIADPGEKILDPAAPLRIADAVIDLHFRSQNQRTLHYCSDSFWKWDNKQYVEMQEGEIRQIVYSYLRDAKQIEEEKCVTDFNPNKYKVDQVIDALHSTCYHTHNPTSGAIWLDGRCGPRPKFLISFRNGLLNLTDWHEHSKTPLIPHTPSLMNVNSLPFDFDPAAAVPQKWHNFLNTLWAEDLESQLLLQEWMGYLLTQDTSFNKILLMVGPPRSGKGTIGRILRELLGHGNVVGPTLSSLGGEFGLQPFLNMTLALISDARINGKHNNVITERLLSISGEDPLTINRKFRNPLTTQLPTRIMMMSNELPDMRDSSGALVTRYLVLTLKQSWLGKEDPALFNQLQAELSGILLWALQGLTRLQGRGYFIQPASSNQTIEDLEALTSPMRAFVSEKCLLKSNAMESVNFLFSAWQVWRSENGYGQGSKQSFGKNLHAAYPQIKTRKLQDEGNRERYYEGIMLLPD